MNPQERSTVMEELKKHILSYSQSDDRSAWLSLMKSVFFQVMAVVLIWLDYGVVGWSLSMLNSVRLFMQFHDMAHFSFFKSMWLNKAVGKVIGVYVHFPFQSWRDGHNHHHKHFGNLDRVDLSQTILFTKDYFQAQPTGKRLLIRIFREPIVFFTITAPYAWFVGLLFINVKRYGLASLVTAQKIASILLYTFIFPLLGVPAWKMWLSIYLADIIGTILFHLQHSVNDPYRARKDSWDFHKAALEGSTFLEVPFVLKPFTNGIEYHHIHHLNTNVPCYSIGQCHQLFENSDQKGKCWDRLNINRVGSWHALKSLMNVMLDEKTGELVPFHYGF